MPRVLHNMSMTHISWLSVHRLSEASCVFGDTLEALIAYVQEQVPKLAARLGGVGSTLCCISRENSGQISH